MSSLAARNKRIAIARTMITKPRVIVADEPTGALDSATSLEVIKLLQEINNDEGVTDIIVTREAEVSRVTKRIIRLKDGIIAEQEEQL
jgi:putative ABC transport system ATP-binding protein